MKAQADVSEWETLAPRLEALYRQLLALQAWLELVEPDRPVSEAQWFLCWHLLQSLSTEVDQMRSLGVPSSAPNPEEKVIGPC